jgi:hypothetical protein
LPELLRSNPLQEIVYESRTIHVASLDILERWFYTARNEKKDPVQALRRKIHSDQNGHPALSQKLRELLAAQYREHPN